MYALFACWLASASEPTLPTDTTPPPAAAPARDWGRVYEKSRATASFGQTMGAAGFTMVGVSVAFELGGVHDFGGVGETGYFWKEIGMLRIGAATVALSGAIVSGASVRADRAVGGLGGRRRPGAGYAAWGFVGLTGGALAASMLSESPDVRTGMAVLGAVSAATAWTAATVQLAVDKQGYGEATEVRVAVAPGGLTVVF